MLTEEALRGASMEVQKFLMESVPEEETPHQFSEKFEKKMKRTILWNRVKRWIPAMVTMAIALALFIYSQCTAPNVLWDEPLSEADKELLKKEIYAYEVSTKPEWSTEVWWPIASPWAEPYYGTINNCTVVRAEMHSVLAVWLGWGRYEVADHIFYWHKPFRLYVYRDGEVCLLDEAYEKGWLTQEQIDKIYEKHQEYVMMMPEDLRTAMEEWAKEKEESQGN